MSAGWRALILVTFSLSLFGAFGAAFFFARWLGFGPAIRHMAAGAWSSPGEAMILALTCFGCGLLVAAAFWVARENARTDAQAARGREPGSGAS